MVSPSSKHEVICLFSALAMGAFSAPAMAADLKSTSSIAAVTVFPQGAQITRRAEIALEKGSHTLIFNDLTQNLVPNSIRIEGVFDAGVEIGSIDTRKIFINTSALDQGERKRIKDEIERLEDEVAQLSNTIMSANTQISLLQNLANLPAQPRPAPVANPAQSPDWQQILTLIGGMDPVLERIHKAKIHQRKLGRDIKKLKKQLSMHRSRPDGRTEIKVHVLAQQASKGTLSIRYQVRSGRWTPFYDMRLATGSKTRAPELQLVRRAAIAQSSGEDWNGVTLTLSTSRPQASTSAPKLRPLRIGFKSEIVLGRAFSKRKMARPPARMEDLMLEAAPAPMAAARPKPKKAREREARIRSYGFQALYQIAGQVTVKSGGTGKKVRIGSGMPEVKLKIRTAPRLDPTAYLYADMKWNGKTALLPGRTSLYRDGAFTGSGSIPLINPGEDHELGFGADDMVKVKRVQLAREKSVSGIISRSRVDVQDYKITVKNRHERALPVTVLDQIPYSEEEDIRVTLLPATTKPTRTDDNDRRGVLAWDFDLNPGAEHVIRLNYKLEWPKGKKTVIRPR